MATQAVVLVAHTADFDEKSDQGVQGGVLACTAPSKGRFLPLYFDFLTFFCSFSSSLQSGNLSALSVGIQTIQGGLDDGLACPEL